MKSAQIRQQFQHRFDGNPDLIVSAPGRVNLIGEHTDYNAGFVFPVAIDKYVTVAARSRADRRVVLYAADFDQTCEFSLDGILPPLPNQPRWSDYPKGVAHVLLQNDQPIGGLDAVISGDVPLAVGLASSAAIEVSSALAFLNAGNLKMGELELAKLCQRAENEFVGVNCGIMDPTISIVGKANHALFLDCRSLDYERVPLNLADIKIMVCNTNVKRELAGSEYNKRRAECEKGVEILKAWYPSISALRDVSLADFKKHEASLPPLTQKRCRYVIEENERVLHAVEVLKAGDLQEFGRLMNASHDGLRDAYEVSCKELDTMVEIAQTHDGVIGARMTGAGFGGCTVNLVHRDAVEPLSRQIMTEYPEQTGIEPEIYICTPGDGARVEFE
jgi:galactokinase